MNKICPPYKNCKITDCTQGYSKNHPANDFCPTNPYGKFLVSPCNGRICSIVKAQVINEDMTEYARGYGIMISEDNTGMYFVYWHCLPEFPVNLWQKVRQGEIIAQMGNSGDIFSSGVFIPVEKRNTPPYLGTHLHYEAFTLNPDGTRNYINPLILIDFSIPIQTSMKELLDKIKSILFNLSGLIKGR